MTRLAAALVALCLVPACTLAFPPELVPCSTLAGRTTDLAPEAPPPPALGERFVDPTFGTCITRVSDVTRDAMIPDEPRSESLDPFGFVAPDGATALYPTLGYRLYAYDLDAPGRGAALRAFIAGNLGFEGGSSLSMITVDAATESLERYGITAGSYTAVSSLEGRLPYMPDGMRGTARSLSADGTRALLSIEHGGAYDLAVIEVATGALIGLHADDAERAYLSPSGRWVVQLGASAWHFYPADFSSEGIEVPADRTLRDADTLALGGGHDGFAVVDGTQLVVFDLDVDGAPREAARLPLVDPAFLGGLELEVTLDGGAVDRPGWLVVTMGPCDAGSTMCTDPSSWARPKIAIVGVGAEVVVHDLAWHFGQRVHATPTRDLSRIVFTSSWGGGPSEAYVIEIPERLVSALR